MDKKDLAAQAAGIVIKKAAFSASAAIAPYVAIGCAIIAGLYAVIMAAIVLSVLTVYGICNSYPTAIKMAAKVASIMPGSTAKMVAQMEPMCAIFKQKTK